MREVYSSNYKLFQGFLKFECVGACYIIERIKINV